MRAHGRDAAGSIPLCFQNAEPAAGGATKGWPSPPEGLGCPVLAAMAPKEGTGHCFSVVVSQ